MTSKILFSFLISLWAIQGMVGKLNAQETSEPSLAKKITTVEEFLRKIADSRLGPAWELQHYNQAIKFPPKQLIGHFRKVEQALLKKGIANDVAEGKPIPIETGLRFPLQGELSDTLSLMNLNPAPEFLPELKRVIESSQLPDYIRGKAVRVFGTLGGDSQYLRQLIEQQNDWVRASAVAALGLQLSLLPDTKLLDDFYDLIWQKGQQREEGKVTIYYGTQTESMIGEIQLIRGYRELIYSPKYGDYSTRLIRLFDRIYLDDGGISESPSAQYAARAFQALFIQNEDQATKIIQDYVNQKEQPYRGYGCLLMLWLNLPLDKQERAELEKMLVPLDQYRPLTVPGIPIYQGKNKAK